jgi:pimeloyl-ACP methyl ester carboxylesterase
MEYTQSSDGTKLAYERLGGGRPLVIVDGAMCYRDSGPARPLATRLADDFAVFVYDRRGRGDSGPAGEVSVEREIEDLDQIIKEAGGSVFLYGSSSGAVLALEAANRGLGVEKLALYEAPLIVDDTRSPMPDTGISRLAELIEAGDNGRAVKEFMRFVEVPGFVVALMSIMPMWSKLKAVAPTLRFDYALLDGLQFGRPLPTDRWTTTTMPTLVADGGKSPIWMRNGTRALADVLPEAEYQTLPGQNHLVKPDAIAPVLREFFQR